MTFVSFSKLAKEVKTKVTDDKSVEKAALKQDVSLSAVVLTEVDKKHAGLPLNSLQDLFHNVETDKEISGRDTSELNSTFLRLNQQTLRNGLSHTTRRPRKSFPLRELPRLEKTSFKFNSWSRMPQLNLTTILIEFCYIPTRVSVLASSEELKLITFTKTTSQERSLRNMLICLLNSTHTSMLSSREEMDFTSLRTPRSSIELTVLTIKG